MSELTERYTDRNHAILDSLYIQEMLNEMARNNLQWTKSWQLLVDWSRELRDTAFLQGKRKKLFVDFVGKEMW